MPSLVWVFAGLAYPLGWLKMSLRTHYIMRHWATIPSHTHPPPQKYFWKALWGCRRKLEVSWPKAYSLCQLRWVSEAKLVRKHLSHAKTFTTALSCPGGICSYQDLAAISGAVSPSNQNVSSQPTLFAGSLLQHCRPLCFLQLFVGGWRPVMLRAYSQWGRGRYIHKGRGPTWVSPRGQALHTISSNVTHSSDTKNPPPLWTPPLPG